MGQPKQTCFVIMPFTVRPTERGRYAEGHWTVVYEHLIAKAVQDAGCSVERDDEDASTRFITEDIWRKIEQADVVVCDLSSHNPNVYLELGWTLRANKPFVLLVDGRIELPFNVRHISTVEYDLRPDKLERGRKALANAITSALSHGAQERSIVERLELGTRAREAAAQGSLELVSCPRDSAT